MALNWGKINKQDNQSQTTSGGLDWSKLEKKSTSVSVPVQTPTQNAFNILNNATKTQNYNDVNTSQNTVTLKGPMQALDTIKGGNELERTLAERQMQRKAGLNVQNAPLFTPVGLAEAGSSPIELVDAQRRAEQELINITQAQKAAGTYEEYMKNENQKVNNYRSNLQNAMLGTDVNELVKNSVMLENAKFGERVADLSEKYDDWKGFANYNLGDLQIEYNEAMAKYYKTQNPSDLNKAKRIEELINLYSENATNVGKGGIFTKDFAGYLPQLVGQTKAGITGAIAGGAGGATTGAIAGSVLPGAGTAVGALKGLKIGAKAGYVGGVTQFSHEQMTGAAYSELLKLGVPNDIAREVASDTALWQSVVEGLGSTVDVATLGIGKLFSKGAKTATQLTAKKLITDALKAYGINLASETAEEAIQEKIAIESEKKALEKSGIERATTDEEDWQRIVEAGKGGFKISLISGGGNFIGTLATTKLDSSTINKVNNNYENRKNIVEKSNLTSEEKQQRINELEQGRQETVKAIEQAISENSVQNVAQQSPNTQIQQQINEVIPQQIENEQNANLVQNNTQITQNTPNNEPISQNNVQNAQDFQKTGQLYNKTLALPTNNTNGEIKRQDLLDLAKNFKHKGETFIDERYKNGKKETSNIIKYNEVDLNQKNINILRKLANNFAKKKYTDAIIKNADTGIDTVVGKKGIRETLSKDINREKLSVMDETLIKSIEEAIYKESSLDTDSKNNIYHYLVSMIENGEHQKALNYITIKETPNRNKFYYNTVEKIEDSLLPSRPGNNTGVVVNAINESPVSNIIQSNENYVNNQENILPTPEQLQARDLKQGEEISNTLNMKKPKLEDIAELTEKEAQLPTLKYKGKPDKDSPYKSKFLGNIKSSKIISQQIKDTIEVKSYERKANADVLKKMQDKLSENPMKTVTEWLNKKKNFTEQDVALGAILMQEYQSQGRFEEAVDVTEKLLDMAPEVGRAVQMYSIFQRLTPEGMMMYQQRKLNSALEALTQKQTGKWVEQNKDKFKLTEDDATFITAKVQEAQNAPTERQKQIALAEIESRINDKLPPEAGQSVKAFRRIAMLFNPKTQVRNVAGNITVMPLNYVTDLVATGIDKAIAKKTGVRTTSLPNLQTIGKGFKKGITETIDDYRRGIRTTPTGSRYEIQNNAKSFNENTNNKVRNLINNKLNGIDRILSTVLELGDRPFYEASYQNALEAQMKANNVTEPTQEMIDIASNVALSQTWQDNNNYTQAVLGIRSAFNKININGFGLGDLIIPFAKTPANLTKAMVEYSPAGMIPSIINYNDMQKAISRGDMTPMQQKKFVTSVGKAVAGTLLYTLAGALVQGGAVTGSSDEDKDVANFEKNVLGIQPYSIKMGDKTFTYNWAQPLATPFAIMADTYKMSDEGAKWNEILVNAFKVAGDQLVANSFLQGIQELLSSEYGNESAMDNLVGALMDLPTQFTPTLLGQFATQFDSTKRQTFENGDTVGTMVNEVKNKLPGAKNTLAPQVNTFGEEIQNYGGDNNPFNIFLNPGNISSTNASETQKELYKLYQDTKDKTIFPVQAPYSLSGGGEKVTLSSKDRADYQKTSGKFVSENLEALFNSEYYKSLDNDKKAEVVTEIVTDANTLAKGEYLETKASKELKEKLSKLGDIPYVEYYNAWSATRDIKADKNWKGESISGSKKKKQIQAVNNAVSKDLTIKQRETLYGLVGISGY